MYEIFIFLDTSDVIDFIKFYRVCWDSGMLHKRRTPSLFICGLTVFSVSQGAAMAAVLAALVRVLCHWLS
jgi:hypothetical protein